MTTKLTNLLLLLLRINIFLLENTFDKSVPHKN